MMDTVNYKCANCGGPLQFDAAKQKFACEYCGSDFTEQELQSRREYSDLDARLSGDARPEPAPSDADDDFSSAAAYLCQSCGAEVIADQNTAATFCVYCHSPVVLSNRMTGEMKPHKVIPFKISEQEAKNRFLAFCKKKKFLPGDFLSSGQLDMMKGVYYPYWLIDSLKKGGVRATAKKKRRWTEGEYEYTETKTYRVVRAGSIDFKGYPCSGVKSEENSKALKYVNPFQDEDFRPFTMSYLSGFLAEKRDVERQDVQQKVDKELYDYARKIFRESIDGYDSVTIDDMSLNTMNETWQYGLLPVWMLTYSYKGKNYLYAMNGQTGKNFGELPLSGAKLAVFAAALFAGVFLLGTLGGYFLL